MNQETVASAEVPVAVPSVALRLLHDQVLVEPLQEFVPERFERKVGLLWTPDKPKRQTGEILWLGRVVLCGPGDKYKYGPVRTEMWGVSRKVIPRPGGGRWPMHVKVGDLVVYERRPWAEIQWNGKTCCVFHEEQHLVAVLDDGEFVSESCVSS
jgi:co-chaperonin GroES (HSP10)